MSEAYEDSGSEEDKKAKININAWRKHRSYADLNSSRAFRRLSQGEHMCDYVILLWIKVHLKSQ